MDNLKVDVRQLASTARVLSQILSKLNKEKDNKFLKNAIVGADKTFDSARSLDKALKKYKAIQSVPKRDFDSKLEDLFRQVFSFLDSTELNMGKYQGDDLKEAKKMLFLAKKEAKDVLTGVRILHNHIKTSGL